MRVEALRGHRRDDRRLAVGPVVRLDAGLLALPVADDQLHTEFLFEEPFVLAVPEGHALASQSDLAMDELGDQNLLLLEEGHCLRNQALEVCSLAGAGEKEGFRATSLETLRQMVAAGVGVTLLPMLAVKPPVPPSANLRLLPFRNPPPSRRLALVWRKSSAMSEFLQQLAQVFRDLPPGLLEPDAPAHAAGASVSRPPEPSRPHMA